MFIMEQWCSSLLLAIKSQKEPYTCLALWQYQAAQFFEIINHYNITELMHITPNSDNPSHHEKHMANNGCMCDDMNYFTET